MANFRCGGPGVAFLESTVDGGSGSGAYRSDVGAEGPDLVQEGGVWHLTRLVQNEWVEYRVNVNQSRMWAITPNLRSSNTNGRFRLQVIRNGAIIHTSNTIAVPNTQGAWNDRLVTVNNIPLFGDGNNIIRFVVETGGFEVRSLSASSDNVTPCYELTRGVSPNNSGSTSVLTPTNCTVSGQTQGYEHGTVVTLSASPAAGYAFTNWSGNASGTNSTVSITMDGTKNVTANFSTCLTLTTAVSPLNSGSITRSPAPNCGTNGYAPGTAVTLSAVPNTGYAFNNWSGGASGTNSSVTITMNANTTVTANYSQCFALTTAVNPANSGTLSVSPAPNCGSQYIAGTTLTFNAVPGAGNAFANWSGALSGNTRPATLVINNAASVTANFAPMPEISENFESGNLTGGTGWNGPWSNPSNATVTNSNSPNNGSGYHLWMQGQGSLHRAANLTPYSEAILEFYWRINADAITDYLYVEMSNNGTNWTVMATLDNRAGQDVYIWRQIFIPPTFRTETFQVRFRSNGNDATDYFYLDDIRIFGTGY
jgi:hypothetical protein